MYATLTGVTLPAMPPTGSTAPRPRKRAATKAKAPTKKQAAARRPGRPLRLTEVINAERGTTIGDRIVQAVAAGNYLETAAATAGINKTTLYDWMRRGARLAADDAEGRRSRFTADERALMEFSNAVGTALAQSEAGDVTNLARLGQGGIPQEVTTIKVAVDRETGETLRELERTTRTTHTLPDAGVLEWRLERRFRERWGRQVEVTGAGGGPLSLDLGASAVEVLEAELDKVARRLARPTGAPAETPTGEPEPNP